MKDPFKRFQMLKDIILVQPCLSAYYETTKLVFDKRRQKQQHNEKLGYDQEDDGIMMINDDESKTNAKF